MENFRKINEQEVRQLKLQRCHSEDWSRILVDNAFKPERVWDAAFSGDIRLGVFESKFELPGGVRIQSGICHAKLHNVTVGNNTCIENIHNYIANYDIGSDCIIENVDRIVVEGTSSFGNGVDIRA